MGINNTIAPTVIEAINKIGSVFYGPVLATFLAGIHSRKISPVAMNIGLLAGVGTNVFLWLSDSTLFWFWWNLIGFVITLVVAGLSSFILPNDSAHKLASVRGISYQAAAVLVAWSGILTLTVIYLPDWLS